ncbi:acyl carrier protein [Streptomyces sp. NPDC050560]|uniref:acyl carrier protein n=1 Tax=Streptomyces sp. NPDC050560 TaxID=3365630 RepID=UPI0037891A80
MNDIYEELVRIVVELSDETPERIGPATTFGELDLDSLSLIEISMRVERRLGVVLDDAELGAELTLAGTAELIGARRAG